jgi:hypothetical protein
VAGYYFLLSIEHVTKIRANIFLTKKQAGRCLRVSDQTGRQVLCLVQSGRVSPNAGVVTMRLPARCSLPASVTSASLAISTCGKVLEQILRHPQANSEFAFFCKKYPTQDVSGK